MYGGQDTEQRVGCLRQGRRAVTKGMGSRVETELKRMLRLVVRVGTHGQRP